MAQAEIQPYEIIENIAATAANTAAEAVASDVSDATTTAINNAFEQQAAEEDDNINNDPIPPEEYEFTRKGISTVFYTGQTARLKMAGELYSAFSDPTKTENKRTENQLTNSYHNL